MRLWDARCPNAGRTYSQALSQAGLEGELSSPCCFGHSEWQISVRVRNLVVRLNKDGMSYEDDPWHVETLVLAGGLELGNAAAAPGVKPDDVSLDAAINEDALQELAEHDLDGELGQQAVSSHEVHVPVSSTRSRACPSSAARASPGPSLRPTSPLKSCIRGPGSKESDSERSREDNLRSSLLSIVPCTSEAPCCYEA